MSHLSSVSDSNSISLFCPVLARFHVGTMLVNAAGHICSVNPALAATFGVSENHLVNADFMQHIHPDDTPAMNRMFRQLVDHAEDFLITVRFLCKNRDIAWGRFSGLHIETNPQFPAVVAALIVEDVTPQHRLRDILATISVSSEILCKYDEQLTAEKRGEHLRKIAESVAAITALL